MLPSSKTSPEADQQFITRGAREQIAVDMEREYERRLLAARQRLPFGQREKMNRVWSLRAGVTSHPQHERFAEMLVELGPTTIGRLLDHLNAGPLKVIAIVNDLGPLQAMHLANRFGLSGIAVIDNDTLILTPDGKRLVRQLCEVEQLSDLHDVA